MKAINQLCIALLFFFQMKLAYAQITTALPSDYSMGRHFNLVFEDANADGYKDLLTPGNTGVEIRFNNGNGQFGANQIYFPNLMVTSTVAMADINGDQLNDLLITDWSNLYVRFQSPTNPGTFLTGPDFVANFGNASVNALNDQFPLVPGVKNPYECADINGDGWMDVIMNSSTEGDLHVQVFTNQSGNLINTSNHAILPYLSSPQLRMGDINGDGLSDIVMNVTRHAFGSPIPGFVSYLLNDGSGSFLAPQHVNTNGALWETGLVLADMDGNGTTDVVIGGRISNDIRVNTNILSGSPLWSVYPTDGSVFGMDAADMDNDGDQDIVVSVLDGINSGVQLHYNSGNGVLNNFQRLNANAVTDVEADDLNGDGLFDLGARQYFSASNRIWLTQTASNNLLINGSVSFSSSPGNCTAASAAPNRQVCVDGAGTRNIVFTNAAGQYQFSGNSATSYDVDLCSETVCQPQTTPVSVSSASPTTDFVLPAIVCQMDYDFTGSPTVGSYVCPNGGFTLNPCPGYLWNICFTFRNTGTTVAGFNVLQFHLPGGGTVAWANNGSTVNAVSCGGSGATLTSNAPTAGSSAPFLFFSNAGPIVLNPGDCYTICLNVSIISAAPTYTFMVVSEDPCSGFLGDVLLEELTYNSSCSCDPNFIEALPLGCGAQNVIEQQAVTYRVHFGNIGVGPAKDIWVLDRLDSDLDFTSFEAGASSHPVTSYSLNQSTGELRVKFDDINLAAGASGWFEFNLLPHNLISGIIDSRYISNEARIYFDNNPPVSTNTVFQTVIDETLSLHATSACEYLYIGYGNNTCVNLQAVASGGVLNPNSTHQFLWSTGETGSLISVCPSETTVYTVTATDDAGCSTSVEITVYVQDVRCGLKRDKISICHNGNTICVAPESLGAHIAHGDRLGDCSVGCVTASLNKMGQEERSMMEEGSIRIYPNPSGGIINIKHPLEETVISVEVYDLNQRLIKSNSAMDSIDLSELSAGQYLIRVTTSVQSYFERIIRQ